MLEKGWILKNFIEERLARVAIIKNIEVISYNSEWPRMFEEEAALIKKTLVDNCVAIHHVGSTSVPNLSAKPIIDIIGVVENPEAAIPILEFLGFKYKGEYNIPMHFGFSKRATIKVNLHVYKDGHPEIELNILFRDYLRDNPAIRDEYAHLKKDLLKEKSSFEKHNSLFTGYNLGKNTFINKVLRQAGFDRLRVARCTHYAEWEAYHRIRSDQIFNPIHVVYDHNHPTLTAENHYHFVLYKGTDIVTVAHLEFLNDHEATFRSLATDKHYKKNGYGSYMMNFLERWVKQQQRQVIKIHAYLHAEGFYKNRGYTAMPFGDVCINSEFVNLGKIL